MAKFFGILKHYFLTTQKCLSVTGSPHLAVDLIICVSYTQNKMHSHAHPIHVQENLSDEHSNGKSGEIKL